MCGRIDATGGEGVASTILRWGIAATHKPTLATDEQVFEKVLANRWNRKRITKTAPVGRESETIREIPNIVWKLTLGDSKRTLAHHGHSE